MSRSVTCQGGVTIFTSEIRKAKGITQIELAKKVGVSRSTVAMWEAGHRFPTATKLPKIAETLNCTIDDLFNASVLPAS